MSYTQPNSCLRKKRYPSKAVANEARDRKAREADIPMSSYRCENCGGYHLCKRKNAAKEQGK